MRDCSGGAPRVPGRCLRRDWPVGSGGRPGGTSLAAGFFNACGGEGVLGLPLKKPPIVLAALRPAPIAVKMPIVDAILIIHSAHVAVAHELDKSVHPVYVKAGMNC